MVSSTPQVQAVDFLWRPKDGWSGQKWTKITKNGFLGDFFAIIAYFEVIWASEYVILCYLCTKTLIILEKWPFS